MVDFTGLWSILDWGVILLYFVAVIAVALGMRKRASKNMKSFYVASRRFTIPVLIGVGAAGWYDSWTIVGLAECGTTMGICIIFMYVIPNVILKIPLALWVGPFVRERIPDWVVTMPDLMNYLYSRKTKLAMALGMMPIFLYEAALLTAGGQVLAYITGINMWVAFIVMGVIIIFYTSMSGLWGLAVTDMIQFVVMSVGAGMLCLGIYQQFGGFGSLFAQASAINPNLTTFSGGYGPPEFFAWMIGALAMYANAQSYQRFGSSKSAGDLKVGYTLVMLFGALFSSVMVLGGMAALVNYPEIAASSPSQAFWATVMTVLPIGLRGFFVAALLSAVMSTVSADYLIAGTLVSHDIIKEFIRPNMTAAQEVKLTKKSIWVIGLLIIVCTYFWQDGIARAYYYIGGFQVAAFIIPLMLGLFYKKRTPSAGFVSLVSAVIFYALWQFIFRTPFGIPTNVACIMFSASIYLITANMTYGGYRLTKEGQKGKENE